MLNTLHVSHLTFSLFLSLVLLTACKSNENGLLPSGEQAGVYLSPTLAPAATEMADAFLAGGVRQDEIQQPPTSPAQPTSIEAGPPLTVITTVPCSNDLTFVSDLSIPDGTLVAAGEVIDKRWQVENSGTCNWNASYRLHLMAGTELGASIEQALYPALGGTQAVIRILLTAPAEPGTYSSAWQAYSPQGEPFGDPIFVEFQVTTPE